MKVQPKKSGIIVGECIFTDEHVRSSTSFTLKNRTQHWNFQKIH